MKLLKISLFLTVVFSLLVGGSVVAQGKNGNKNPEVTLEAHSTGFYRPSLKFIPAIPESLFNGMQKGIPRR